MLSYLTIYPNRLAAKLLGEEFSVGFRISSQAVGDGLAFRKLRSALARPGMVAKKLAKEVAIGRIAGPFSTPLCFRA